MAKEVFLQNGGQCKCIHLRLTFKLLKKFLIYLKKNIGQSQPMLKFGGNLSSRSRDMAQNVLAGGLTLKGQFFLSDLRHLLIPTHLKFH